VILLIDNYDSFTYNIYQHVASLGHPLRVVRNDCVTLDEIAAGGYAAVIISPGPGTPDEAGISKDLIARFAGRLPILGVCLGHQAIGEVFGGRVVRAPAPVHGKTSAVSHSGDGLYRGLPQPFTAGRYHSLIIDRATLPGCLAVTATSDDGLIMGVRHKHLPVEGVQFHPESVLTPDGGRLLANFLASLPG